MVEEEDYYRRDIQDYPVIDVVPDHSFDIVDDLDTVLYWHVNSFFHSISNSELQFEEG